MSLDKLRPTERFTDLADLYARCRPDYPEEALAYVMQRGGLHAAKCHQPAVLARSTLAGAAGWFLHPIEVT